MWHQLMSSIKSVVEVCSPALRGVNRPKTRREYVPVGSQPRFPRSTVLEQFTPLSAGRRISTTLSIADIS